MSTQTAPERDWWYVRAYPGSSHGLEDATRALVPWVRARAEEMDGSRWFFMRYLDMTGQHLRLRVQAAPEDLDRLHTRIDEISTMLHELDDPDRTSRLLPGADLGELPGRRMVRPAVFAPEIQKYGGPAATEVAVDLFGACSTWFDDHQVIELPQPAQRAALAVDYQHRLVHAALPGSEARSEFWSRHRKQWGWQLRMLLPTRNDCAARADQVRARIEESPPPPKTRAALDGLVADVVAALDRAQRCRVPRSRSQLLLEYLHMDMNRWGLMPAEECLLGLLAEQTAQEASDHTSNRWKDAS